MLVKMLLPAIQGLQRSLQPCYLLFGRVIFSEEYACDSRRHLRKPRIVGAAQVDRSFFHSTLMGSHRENILSPETRDRLVL